MRIIDLTQEIYTGMPFFLDMLRRSYLILLPMRKQAGYYLTGIVTDERSASM